MCLCTVSKCEMLPLVSPKTLPHLSASARQNNLDVVLACFVLCALWYFLYLGVSSPRRLCVHRLVLEQLVSSFADHIESRIVLLALTQRSTQIGTENPGRKKRKENDTIICIVVKQLFCGFACYMINV